MIYSFEVFSSNSELEKFQIDRKDMIDVVSIQPIVSSVIKCRNNKELYEYHYIMIYKKK